MNQKSLDIMRRLLKPVSNERIAEVTRQRVGGVGREQLTLADAGLEDEVREFLTHHEGRQVSPG